MLDIDFGPASDDNLQPRGLCGRISQDLQETRATSSVATLIKCVDDKGESVVRVVWKGAEEIKEKSALHRLWSKVWVVPKVFCYNCAERGKDYGEFVNESGKDVYGLAQIWVVPPTEKRSSKVVSLVKVCTDRMGQRRFSDSR